jgi:hypothetical protein
MKLHNTQESRRSATSQAMYFKFQLFSRGAVLHSRELEFRFAGPTRMGLEQFEKFIESQLGKENIFKMKM